MMHDNGTKISAQAYGLKVALKFVALVGMVLVGSLVLTLLKYAGLNGAIPAMIAFVPTMYCCIKITKSEGGKPAGFILLGLVVFGVAWVIAVGSKG